jgi:hypothetical protein
VTEASPPKPPAAIPPASRRGPAARSLSEGQKEALAIQALGLLNEQRHARSLRYKTELEASAELDTITVAQPKATQPAPSSTAVAASSVEETEEQQVRLLGQLLQRFFGGQSHYVARVLRPIGNRLTQLFFAGKLGETTRARQPRLIAEPEQGLYYLLSRYRHRLRAELDGFEYRSPERRLATLELLARYERELQVAFLSRRSPELDRVLTSYSSVLADFLQKYLPQRLDQMGKATLRVSKAARRPGSVGSKVQTDAFGDFRSEWERLFMQHLVFFCGDELLQRLTPDAPDVAADAATLKFVIDPQVFSDTCAVVCEALYDFLYLEGFLELPVDWRLSLNAS